jgi:shikimate kinase
LTRHIVLLGLPGAGKSTVGKLLAERLGAPYVDVDALIVRKAQKPIARIFAEDGEPHFRQVEAETMRQALTGPAAVIVPGGGWAAQPGALDGIEAKAFLVYLRVMALTAAKRAEQGEEGGRPLLVGVDPVEHMRFLLRERERYYLLAEAEVKADVKSAALIADEIAALAREHAGWQV